VVAAKALGVFFCRRTLDAVFVREAPSGLPAAAAADAPEQRYQARARFVHGQNGGGAWGLHFALWLCGPLLPGAAVSRRSACTRMQGTARARLAPTPLQLDRRLRALGFEHECV